MRASASSRSGWSRRGHRAARDRAAMTPSRSAPMTLTPGAYALLGLTVIVAAVAAALVFALLRFVAAAGEGRRQRGSGETSLLSAALGEAVAKLQAQERATAARAEASERMSDEIIASLTAGLLVVGLRRRRAHPQSSRSPDASRPRTGAAQRLPPAARRAGAVGHHRRVFRDQGARFSGGTSSCPCPGTARRIWA